MNEVKNPPAQEKSREEMIKQAFIISASQKKHANKALQQFAERLHCRLVGLLVPLEHEVRRGNLSRYVYEELVQRIEGQRKRNVLTFEEIAALEKGKTFLREFV